MRATPILLVVFMIFSCNTKCNVDPNNIYIFKFNSQINDDVINGQNLHLFFKENVNIKKQKISVSDSLLNEFKLIKTSSLEREEFQLGFGLYEYAIINMKDTLYASSDLKSWRYKNRTILHNSKLIIEELSSNR